MFCYEAQRLIGDRLVDQASKTKFHGIFSKIIRTHWPEYNVAETVLYSTFRPQADDDNEVETKEGKDGGGGGGAEAKEDDVAAAAAAAAAANAKSLRKIAPEEFLKLAKRGLIVCVSLLLPVVLLWLVGCL